MRVRHPLRASVRKGLGAPPPQRVSGETGEGSGADETLTPGHQGNNRSSVQVIEATAHLNISGCTHMHTGCAWFQAEKGATDGKMTRFDCVAVEALYEDLPDRSELEALGMTINEEADLFLFLNLIKTIADIIVEEGAGKGVMLLTDEAFVVFQAFVNEKVNPQLNKLVMVPAAGAQSSSWSKLKGKVLKMSGVVYLMSLAAEMLEHTAVSSFDFDQQQPHELKDEVTPHIVARVSDSECKIIPAEAVTHAIEWGMMFHETGLALQENMVLRQRLPRASAPADVDGADVDDEHDAANAATATSAFGRLSAAKFPDALQWGCHAVITSKKFEPRMVCASYMTTESSRLLIGSVAQLTGGAIIAGRKPRPTFYAIAKELEKQELAKLIWITTSDKGAGKKKLGEDTSARRLWGIELFDAVAAEIKKPGEIAEPLSQLLRPYQVSVEAYNVHCQVMTSGERATFDYASLVKFSRNPPPKPPPIPTFATESSGEQVAGSGSSNLLALETSEAEGATMEASLFDGARGSSTGTRLATDSPSAPRKPTPGSVRRSARISKTQSVTEADAGAPPASPAAALDFAPQAAPEAVGLLRNLFKRARGT